MTDESTQSVILYELRDLRNSFNVHAQDTVQRLSALETKIETSSDVVPAITERVHIQELFKYQLMGICVGASAVISVCTAWVGWMFRGAPTLR
jgi:hypothetical protein